MMSGSCVQNPWFGGNRRMRRSKRGRRDNTTEAANRGSTLVRFRRNVRIAL